MTTSKLGQSSFTGGIFSDILDGQTNFAKYDTAVKRMENFLIWPHGPATFRPGFKFVAETKSSNLDSALIPFEFSVEQPYMIEAGDDYFRFFKNKAPIESSPGVPYEVLSPYSSTDVGIIKYTQSADVLYLFHQEYPAGKLSRTGDTAWVYNVINWNPGPMSEQKLEPDATLTLGAVSGENVTFTASASTFLEGDIGRVIASGVGRASIVGFTSSTIVECDIIDAFSSVGPIPSGDWDMAGSPNAPLNPNAFEPKGSMCTLESSIDLFRPEDVGKFVRINSGAVKLTTITTPQTVKGEIIRVLTDGTESTAWTLETDMWTEALGYPRAGTFFDDRLMAAGSTNNPETVWGSVVGDYENHTPGIDDSDAVQFSLRGRKVNIIRWIEPRDYLMIGTVGGEWRLGPEDIGTPLTPLNVVAKEVTTKGCADILPVTVDGSTLFVQRHSRKLRELAFDFAKGESGGYTAPDLTQLAKDLTIGGINAIAYQQEPFQTLWVAVTGGNLIGLTYLREQQVVAWHEHPMPNGEVLDLATIPGDGYDEVWAIIERTIDGQQVRYVEVMEKVFEDTNAQYAANLGLNAFFVDSGVTYNGVETTTMEGADHLEGQEVVILADGATQKSKTVVGGTFELDKAASVVHYGLPYTGTIQTLRIDVQLQDGTSQAREKRIVDMFARVLHTGPFKAGRDEDHLDLVQDPEISLVYGDPYPLFTGDLRTSFDGDYNRGAQMFIVQDKPMPCTIQAVYPEVEVI